MDGKLNIFEAIGRKMSWLGQRQSVLSENIANADTPDYVPQDLKTGAFPRALATAARRVQPTATNAQHLQGIGPKKGSYDESEQRGVYEVAPSGNAVVLEEQLVKVGQTQMHYQAMTNLYRKHLSMIRTALRSGS